VTTGGGKDLPRLVCREHVLFAEDVGELGSFSRPTCGSISSMISEMYSSRRAAYSFGIVMRAKKRRHVSQRRLFVELFDSRGGS
jgi:hypothetical protein